MSGRQLTHVGRIVNGETHIFPVELLPCATCGDTADVVVRLEYVAGCYEPIAQCWDREACWQRWDREHLG